jgi:hypothetical protein
MSDRIRRSCALLVLACLSTLVTACESNGSGEDASPPDDDVVRLDLTGEEECAAAGYEEFASFFEANSIEIWKQEIDTEDLSYCSISMHWAEPRNEDEEEQFNSWLRFGLKEYDSTEEAEEVLQYPQRVQMSNPELRDDADVLSEVPGPWEDGFIWSQPDEERSGPTEVAARISNIVLYVDFKVYHVPDVERCESDGCVISSELVSWLHDEYLPAVGTEVNELIDG